MDGETSLLEYEFTAKNIRKFIVEVTLEDGSTLQKLTVNLQTQNESIFK